MTAEQKAGLRCYRQYIEKTLNPAYVLGNMKEWLSDGEMLGLLWVGALGMLWPGRP